MKTYYNYTVRLFLLSLVDKMFCEYHGNSKGEIVVKCYYHDVIGVIERFIYSLDREIFSNVEITLSHYFLCIPVDTEKIIFYNDYLKIVVYH